jgi:hypothetical protein
MKFAIALSAAAMLVAGAAQASDKVTDVEYLKANRCKGLATTLTGVVDGDALNAFVKAEAGARAPYIIERAQAEFTKARREAKDEARRERLTAELSGPCTVFVSAPSSVAKQ